VFDKRPPTADVCFPDEIHPPFSAIYFFAAFRAFFGAFLAEVIVAPAIAKSSSVLPDLIPATSHRGLSPRPAQVSEGLSGLRYLWERPCCRVGLSVVLWALHPPQSE
jgi:hypothetical protein